MKRSAHAPADDAPSLDIVPPHLLLPSAAAGLRHLPPADAASLLDGYLRRLAGHEARCRVVLGRLARAFLRRRAHHPLGFARLGDFARERLGLSGREVQSLAHVAERLRELPAVAAAFARGELCWTRVRQLVAVAKPENENTRGRDPDDDTIDGEPRVTVRVECPRRVRARWRDAIELARRMWGADVPMWQVAEAVGAEGLSARGFHPEDILERECAPPDVPQRGRPRVPVDAPSTADALPEAIDVLARGCDDVDAFALDRRLRLAVRALQRIDWQTGRLLWLLCELRLHRPLGFASLYDYVRARLAVSPRKARALIAVERRTADAPPLAETYRHGGISWVRVLTVLPVARGTVAAAWVERAGAVTVKRLADEVDWALAMRDAGRPRIDIAPPPPGAPLGKPGWQIGAREVEVPDALITFPAPASVATLLQDAIATFREPGEPPWQGLEHLLDHARHTWEALPRHRDPIFARDGWRCAVPACTARQSLHDHHVLFRSRGGDNRRDNRVTVCAAHHLRGIHQGRIRARGEAPDAILWELGVRPGRPPLLRLLGERYLDVAEFPLSHDARAC